MFGKDSDGTQGQAQASTDGTDQPQTAGPVTEAGANSGADPSPHQPVSTFEEPGAGSVPGPDDPANAAPFDPNRDVISPAGGYPSSPNTRITTSGSGITFTSDDNSLGDDLLAATPDDASNDAELIEIKQKALDELLPLIDKLDLPPQDKFRTIMMMIQSSDNEKLVEKAYETAHTIEDDKARAQALLDIVNEINYFTQPHDK